MQKRTETHWPYRTRYSFFLKFLQLYDSNLSIIYQLFLEFLQKRYLRLDIHSFSNYFVCIPTFKSLNNVKRVQVNTTYDWLMKPKSEKSVKRNYYLQEVLNVCYGVSSKGVVLQFSNWLKRYSKKVLQFSNCLKRYSLLDVSSLEHYYILK